MTKGARMMGAATAGVFLLMDVISLVKESMHLHDGAKTESAAELRQQARSWRRCQRSSSRSRRVCSQAPLSEPSAESHGVRRELLDIFVENGDPSTASS
jgi:hypothetical protein